MGKTMERIFNKITSGRFIMTIAFSLTYCLIMVGSVIMVIKKIINIEVFLGLFSGFTAILMTIKDSYFFRSDRHKDNGKEIQ